MQINPDELQAVPLITSGATIGGGAGEGVWSQSDYGKVKNVINHATRETE